MQASRVESFGPEGHRVLLDTHAGEQPPPSIGNFHDASTPEPAELLSRIETALTSHVVLPPWAPPPIALWVMCTYPSLLGCFDAVAYLAVTSPTPGCGKTRLLELMEYLSWNPMRTGNISESALFRAISEFSPTLLFDEAETLSGKGERAEMLRGILNAGNRRDSFTYRCVGGAHEVQKFAVFGPKVFACIGQLPRTISDRAICIPMQKRRDSERIARLTKRRFGATAEAIRRDAGTVTKEIAPAVREVYGSLELEFLPDRDEEAWAPLFAVCAVLAPDRVPELKMCAVESTRTKLGHAEAENIRLTLLADVRQVWPAGQPVMLTKDLLALLADAEGGTWQGAGALTARRLAGLLRAFGIERRSVRLGETTGKGYALADLRDVFARYLRPETADKEGEARQV